MGLSSFLTGNSSTAPESPAGPENLYTLMIPFFQRDRLDSNGMDRSSCMDTGGVVRRPDHLCAIGTSSNTTHEIPYSRQNRSKAAVSKVDGGSFSAGITM